MKALKGLKFSGRYLIGKNIDKGSYGNVYECQDTQSSSKLVIKFSEDFNVLANEI